ncbi:CubicO group peptidase, beta-lactamase class C family [Nonlabens sp. Hel1_33_55]|uniref:serine hydrolase domain-containing protein n=1 Tax=Nonlabens sp. Hel1_33_55 TaxID=1336802 RepID=UPI000875BD8A|nr:serine hydrolase [Nonlabens sp. Hel1_33_55]SCY08084.1 CubicO group peptidase, beta-lactamase class C family [Nonlabens sp. Hel1_33_55]
MKSILLFLACSLTIHAQDNYFPQRHADWEQISTDDAQIDAKKLEDVIAFAKANEYSGSRDLRIAILDGFKTEPFHEIQGPTKKRGGPVGMILKKGKLVASWGDTKRVDMTFSVTKSFLSTVAGIAVDKGLIKSVNDTVANYVWDGTFAGRQNSQITWSQLLQQNSAWQGTLYGGKDWADRPPRDGDIDDWQYAQPAQPGTIMEYNDVRVNVLAYSLLQVFREPLPRVLKKNIMDRIGASTTWRWYGYDNAWETIDGLQMKSVTGGGHSGAGMFINTEDMARFGLLFLNNGQWNGEQLISKEWIEMATTPSTPEPNYGFMWWLNADGRRQWDGVDQDVFYAAGFGGNFIVIDRKNDLVVVTRWLEPNKIGEFMKLLNTAF